MKRPELDGMDIVLRALLVVFGTTIGLSVFIHWVTGASLYTSTIVQMGRGIGAGILLLVTYLGGAYIVTVLYDRKNSQNRDKGRW